MRIGRPNAPDAGPPFPTWCNGVWRPGWSMDREHGPGGVIDPPSITPPLRLVHVLSCKVAAVVIDCHN